MNRSGWIGAGVVSLACTVVAGIAAGPDGVLGAAVGAAVVAVFFTSSRFVLGPILKSAPHLSMVVALTFFLTKVMALVALLYVLLNPGGAGARVDPDSLGGTVIACTLAWTVLLVRSAMKSRTPMYDLNSDE